jgi:hypothetical protein
MAFVPGDWSITRSTGNIRYIGDLHAGTAPSYTTGIEFHRALMDFADAASDVGDDELAIIDNVPSQRGGVDTNITLLNGYNIDDTSAEYLYDTSITQSGGAEIYDGIQVFGNATSIQIIQNGALLANDFWNEAKMIAAVSDAASSTSHRFLVKVRTGGADIDGRRLIGTQRVYGTVYTEFVIGGGTNRGNNVLALTANSDLNNGTASGTVAAFSATLVNSEGYSNIDIDANGADEFYYGAWDISSPRTKNDLYEFTKYQQREGTAETIYGMNGDLFRGITHSVALSGGAGTWVQSETLSWGTGGTAGTGRLLAVDNLAGASATIMYIQLLTGVQPNANLITGAGAATGTAGTVTSRLLSLPYLGASTGSAIIGAFGVGLLAADAGVNDLITALDGVSRNPPNNVIFNVNGIVSGEDYVLVGPEAAGVLDTAQLTLLTSLVGAAETAIVCTSAIPVDTPASGTLRLQNDEGRYVKIPYTSYTGSTFTIAARAFNGTGDNDSATNPRSLFVTYIDKLAAATTESFTTVFNANRTLVVRRRYGGVAGGGPTVPAESTAVLTSAGGSVIPARAPDA